jgi:hypothetical protein
LVILISAELGGGSGSDGDDGDGGGKPSPVASLGVGKDDKLSGAVAAAMLSSLPKSRGSIESLERRVVGHDITYQHDK